MTDPNVEAVKRKLDERAARGLRKYGISTDRGDLTFLDWLRHFQEELLDGAVYAERMIRDLGAYDSAVERANASLPPQTWFDEDEKVTP